MNNYQLRPCAGPSDYPKMLAVLQASKAADGLDDADTLEDLARRYDQYSLAELAADMLIAESAGQPIGFGRAYWQKETNVSTWFFFNLEYVRPEWRGQGVELALLRRLEARSASVARSQAHAAADALYHQSFTLEPETSKAALLEQLGYAPARHFYRMVRPDLNNIPDCPLPAGLEVRPAEASLWHTIWQANVEAFRDHWGEPEHTQAEYQSWQRSALFQPELWQVAWDVATNQVAGSVLGFIDHAQNAQQGILRGWTENIAVRQPWRRRGLAHALMAANLRDLKARGMTEAALGVDTENTSGALHIYESLGFRPVRKDTLWRKPLVLEAKQLAVAQGFDHVGLER